MPRGNARANPYAYTMNTWCTPTQPPPYDAEYYQGPHPPPMGGVNTTARCIIENNTIKGEVKMKVSAKDVTVCASCSSANLTETSDPMVAKECLDCGSLMLIDGDVLQMAV